MGKLLARATRRASLAHIRHVAPVAPDTATGPVAQVYRQLEADFGMLAPPVVLHAPAPGPLAAVWVMLRETLLATGQVSRGAKEAVAAAVSLANRCPYCVEVHGATLLGLLRGPDAAAVAADRIEDVTDPALCGIAAWARSVGGAAPAPFPARHSAELIGVAVTFHYLNRMVNIFLQDSPLPPAPALVRRVARRVAARAMGAMARGNTSPGTSLDLLAAAPPPPDLSWATGRPYLVDAVARASATIDAGGANAVPEPVRRLLLARLDDWTGAPPGPGSRTWLAEATAGLPPTDRAAGKLVLLTAFASYQVTDAQVQELRRHGYDDSALIELTAWASLTTARHIGQRLYRGVEALSTDG